MAISLREWVPVLSVNLKNSVKEPREYLRATRERQTVSSIEQIQTQTAELSPSIEKSHLDLFSELSHSLATSRFTSSKE
ncbi:MAG: hypothetical protein HQ518_24090 [Rhodopirellula sp.]|nr:hypothetical protein [Rhodopirellula sp.]